MQYIILLIKLDCSFIEITEVRLRNQVGVTIVLCASLCLSKEQPGLDPRVGVSVNSVAFPVATTTLAKSAFSEGSLSTSPEKTTSSDAEYGR